MGKDFQDGVFLILMQSNSVSKTIFIRGQILLSMLLLAFCIVFSVDYHPAFLIDLIVTSFLLLVYASAVYFNYFVLVPRFFRSHAYLQYFVGLLISLVALTFLAVFI